MTSWAKPTGFVLGLALAAVALLGWQIPAAGGALGADLTVLAARSGELEVSPAGPVLTRNGLLPGQGAAVGGFAVRNQTGKTLALRLRAHPSSRDLDRLLVLRVAVGGETIYRGALGGLRAWTRRSFALAPSARKRVELRAWLPPEMRKGYQGRIETVTLELRASPGREAR